MDNQRTVDKIKSFADLQTGWHYGEGCPIVGLTQEIALVVENALRGEGFQTDAFPSADGSILVTAYPNGETVDVLISVEAADAKCRIEIDPDVAWRGS